MVEGLPISLQIYHQTDRHRITRIGKLLQGHPLREDTTVRLRLDRPTRLDLLDLLGLLDLRMEEMETLLAGLAKTIKEDLLDIM
jgi:hypothetical protein